MPALRAARLALGFVAAALLAACGDRADPIVADEQLQSMPADQVLTGVTHNMTSEGVRKALLTSDTAYIFEDSAEIHLRSPHLLLYGEHGQQTAELTGETGTLNTRTNAMTVRGNVVLITVEKNRRIETEELHFDEEQDRIWSDVATVMIEGGSRITGTGFTADARMSNVRVLNPRGRVESMRIPF